MSRLKFFIVAVFAFLSSSTIAQDYEADILRFSANNYAGSARFIAAGGAFSSIGADMSNFAYNPAGIGMYRSSVAQFSAGLNFVTNSSSYLDETTSDFKLNASIPSLGFVFASNKPSKNGLFRGTTVGFAFNRLGEYNSSEKITGLNTNPGSSISWNWANEMSEVYNGEFTNETSVDQVSFNTYTGFYGFLANFDSSVLDYTSPVVDSIQQTRFVDAQGGKNEILVALGTNYLDKLYIGASVGIPLVNYRRESRFIEEDAANSEVNTFFNEFELKEEYKTEGLGFNFKLGLLYKVNRWFRWGVGFQTPERVSLTERYSSNLISDLDFDDFNIESGEGVFQYRIRLPWRANTGVSFFFKEKGFFSLDYEAIGFNSMRYTFENDFREVSDNINANLKAKYSVGHNLRAGFEGVIKKFRVRAGYNYNSSPIRKEFQVQNFNYSRHIISGGFGMVFDRVALDLAYQHKVSKQFEQPYEVANATVSGINRNVRQGLAVVTFSYKLR